jgi:TatD DNase family protein
MLVDSHAHLDSERYADDREAMLVRAHEAGVEAILAVGIGEGPDTMHAALDLSREYRSRPDMPQIVVSAGIHPHEANLADDNALKKLDALAREPEVVAVGEIGLDYFYDHSPRELQQRVFVDQMKIAAAHKLPILIHCRASADSTNAWEDTLALLEDHWRATGLGGVLHCFAGEYGHAKLAMDMDFLVSFAGNITFSKAQPIRDVAAKLPADRMLIETDAPFLAPTPNRGKRNEPAMVQRVAEQLAEVRGSDYETMALTTTENFYRFFRLSRTTGSQAGESKTEIGLRVEN